MSSNTLYISILFKPKPHAQCSLLYRKPQKDSEKAQHNGILLGRGYTGFLYLDHIWKRYVENNFFSEKLLAPKRGWEAIGGG